MKPRLYQSQAVNKVVTALREHDRVVLVSPTGSGKTAMANMVVERARRAGMRTFAVSHRKEINEQLTERLTIGSATVQKLFREAEKGIKYDFIDLLIWDEVHHCTADKWKNVLKCFPNAKVLGLTATPETPGGKGMGSMFSDLVCAATPPELVRAGYLAPLRIIRGDEVSAPNLWQSPVDAYLKHTPNGRAFLFAGTREESRKLAAEFNAAGVGAVHVDGDTKSNVRSKAFGDFKSGKVKVLCNVFIATEGVDVVESDTIIIARGCGSPGTFLQMCGRVLRMCEGKKFATLIDLTGASWIHGSPLLRREFSLSEGIILPASFNVVDCPQCSWCGPSRTIECPKCGWRLKENAGRKRKVVIHSKALHEVYSSGAEATEENMAREFTYLRKVCRNTAGAVRAYKRLFDEIPRLSDEELYNILREDAQSAKARGHKIGSAMYKFEGLFGHKPGWGMWNRVKKEVE